MAKTDFGNLDSLGFDHSETSSLDKVNTFYLSSFLLLGLHFFALLQPKSITLPRLELAYLFLLFIGIEYGLRVKNEARSSRLSSFIISGSSLSWSHDNLELNTQTANAGLVVHLGTNMVWNGEQQRLLDGISSPFSILPVVSAQS